MFVKKLASVLGLEFGRGVEIDAWPRGAMKPPALKYPVGTISSTLALDPQASFALAATSPKAGLEPMSATEDRSFVSP